jgi:hypothetical protein
MTKSEDDLIVLPSTNASKVTTNEIFADTQNDPIFNPNVEVKLEEEDLDFYFKNSSRSS